MKKLIYLFLINCLFCLIVTTPISFAQENKSNSKAENFKRAIEIFNRNQALFKDKEMLERYQRLTKNMKKAPKPAIIVEQFQGIIISKSTKNNEIVVRNTESENEKTFIINDKELLYYLSKGDEVQATFNKGSNVAKEVSILAQINE